MDTHEPSIQCKHKHAPASLYPYSAPHRGNFPEEFWVIGIMETSKKKLFRILYSFHCLLKTSALIHNCVHA